MSLEGHFYNPLSEQNTPKIHSCCRCGFGAHFLHMFTENVTKGLPGKWNFRRFRGPFFLIVQRIAFYFLANRPIHPSIFVLLTENGNEGNCRFPKITVFANLQTVQYILRFYRSEIIYFGKKRLWRRPRTPVGALFSRGAPEATKKCLFARSGELPEHEHRGKFDIRAP